ncbi:MAG: hypothetical protein LUQ20_04435 [Candidatus Methanoperedens sp.]|nr:hypothetical protein [Candidatus Methanoperedens sp.]
MKAVLGLEDGTFVIGEACDHPSHHRSTRSIYEFLRDEGTWNHESCDDRGQR